MPNPHTLPLPKQTTFSIPLLSPLPLNKKLLEKAKPNSNPNKIWEIHGVALSIYCL